MGARIATTSGHAPVRVEGGGLHGKEQGIHVAVRRRGEREVDGRQGDARVDGPAREAVHRAQQRHQAELAHPAEAARMGRSARALVEREFTLELQAQRYLDLYTSLIRAPRQ